MNTVSEWDTVFNLVLVFEIFDYEDDGQGIIGW